MIPLLRLPPRCMNWVIAALIMIPEWCFSVDEQQFGRLFTTPEQRQRLQELREEHRRDLKRGNATEPGNGEMSAGSRAGTRQSGLYGEPGEPSVITFKGLVYRKDGTGMAWIDAQEGSAALDYRQLQAGETPEEGSAISVPVSGKSVILKPGQSWHPESGAVTDPSLIAPGEGRNE